MKNFLRSIAGKTLVYLVCLFSLIILMISVCGAFLFATHLEDYYSLSWDQIYKNNAFVNYQDMGFSVLVNSVNSTEEDYKGMVYEILNEDGKILYTNLKNSKDHSVTAWEVSIPYAVEKDENNVVSGLYYDETPYYVRQETEVSTTEIESLPTDPEEETESAEDPEDPDPAPEDPSRETVPGSESRYMTLYTVRMSNTGEFSRGYISNSLELKVLKIVYDLKKAVFIIAAAALILTIVSFIMLMSVTARRPSDDGLYPGPLHKVPYDLLALGLGIFVSLTLILLGSHFRLGNSWEIPVQIGILGIVFSVFVALFLGFSMTTAGRIKTKTLLKNTVIAYVLKYVWRFLKFLGRILKKIHRTNMDILRNIPLIWKVLAVLLLLSLGEFIYLMLFGWGDRDMLFIGFFLEKLILIPLCLYIALCLSRLKKGGELLSKGDLTYVTDTAGMFGDMKIHGEHLNSIAKGMTIAVEDRLKSERMKTELITNVSHDLKTPLTSVINYAQLIQNEQTDNERINEYADVLQHQSERLKRLIEDLVEASKASTGNLEVELTPCDAALFLAQAAGEYEDKLNKADLSLIVRNPEENVMILADGRRMWRIFDNLMNNICKYAQEGTRVYLTLETEGKNAVITFKNTSREALDISEEELMERFVRGDVSRNTEGNGLGLSIARSLSELQGGSLQISIDGDLFKAILTFPLIQKPL